MERIETRVGSIAYRRAGTGSPLVLLHGGLSDGRSWAAQLAGLSDEHDVVAWDAPGCGRSSDPAGVLSLADYADAVADLVGGLGLGRVDLVGHSFGAGLAIEVYARHREIVRSLVLSGAYAGWRGSLSPEEVETRLRRALAELDRPPAAWVDGYLSGFFSRPIPPETRAALRAMMLEVRPAGTRSMVTAFAEADLRDVLPTIAVQTLLLYGADDVRAPRSVAEALRAAIPGAHLVLVPGAGHDVNLEAPEEFDLVVRSFLRSVRDAAGDRKT